MKKIVTFVAALCFVVSGYAEAISCAEAVQQTMAMQAGETGTVDVTVHGFITFTDGVVSSKGGSPNQQVFWMADSKNGGKVFQAYWANLPEPYQTNATALPVGTELNMTGKLMNYNGTTAEMKNGTIEVIDVPVVEIDTFDVTADEAIAEVTAWTVGDISQDMYRVTGKVKAITRAYETNTSIPGYNGRSSFTLEASSATVAFTAYNAYSVEEVVAGDSVVVLGPLQYYAENNVEVVGGKVTITHKVPRVDPQVITVSLDSAIAVALSHDQGWLSVDTFVVENVTVDSISYAYNADKGTQSFYAFGANDKNFIAYSCKVPREIVVGDVVTVKGKLQNYKGDAEINGGTVTVAQGVENIFSGEKAIKRIENGQLVIIKNGVRFNALGVELK